MSASGQAHIVRIEIPQRHTRGFQVRITRDGVRMTKFFAGLNAESLRAAIAFRDHLFSYYGLRPRRVPHFIRGAGVRDDAGQRRICASAIGADGRRLARSFYYRTRPKTDALQAAQSWRAAMENIHRAHEKC